MVIIITTIQSASFNIVMFILYTVNVMFILYTVNVMFGPWLYFVMFILYTIWHLGNKVHFHRTFCSTNAS